jgi:ribosomal protein S12 methylthiotransferase
LIDSENILGRLGAGGYALVGAVEDADVALLNTCSFIGEARAESEHAIHDLLTRKRSGSLKGVIVAGCLPQKFRGEVESRFPDVDAFLGLSDYSNVARVVEEVLKGRRVREDSGGRAPQGQGEFLRLLQTPRSYAYLRPSHGCDHECAFCIIPQIRGKQSSKPLDIVVEEALGLARQGVREIVLVAEDTTGYGTDFGAGAPRLPDLVAALASRVDGLKRLRVMYAYPNAFPWRLMEVMNEFRNVVVPYLDIPVQHGSSAVLKRMRRGGTRESVTRILSRLRAEVPGITLRTTILVGHPGEGEAEFAELLDFLAEIEFDRLGAFAFSPEASAPSGADADRCSPAAAQERLARVMELQARIAFAAQQKRVGSETTVLVDSHEGEWAVARTEADAPEVDPVVRIADPRGTWTTGSMPRVRITAADGYDLIAKVVR